MKKLKKQLLYLKYYYPFYNFYFENENDQYTPSNNNLNDYGTSIKEIDFFGQYFFLLFPNIPSSSFASFSPPLSLS